jgi:hypothetical protein
LQLEADFLKWWTAEEDRIKHEALALAESENALNKRPNSPHKKRRSRRKGVGTEGNAKLELETNAGGSSQSERFERNNPGRQLLESQQASRTTRRSDQN